MEKTHRKLKFKNSIFDKVFLMMMFLLLAGFLAQCPVSANAKNKCFGHPKKPVDCIHCKAICICENSDCEWKFVR